MHTATAMARNLVPGMLPLALVWPYDCERKCGELIRVPRGGAVASELTRNLREPFRSAVRATWESER